MKESAHFCDRANFSPKKEWLRRPSVLKWCSCSGTHMTQTQEISLGVGRCFLIFHLCGWLPTQEVMTLDTVFPLWLAEVCETPFLSSSVSHYFLLCLDKKNAPRFLPFCFHLWFGQSQALCQLSRHTVAWLSSPTLPKPPPRLSPSPPVYSSWLVSTQLWLSDSASSMCCFS